MEVSQIPAQNELLQMIRESAAVCANHFSGSPGMDGMTAERFFADMKKETILLESQIRSGEYAPCPLSKILIKKPGGGNRSVYIASIRDKVVQQMLISITSPIIDSHLSPCCHSYRRDHSIQTALNIIMACRHQGFHWSVESDISAFFDSIPHNRLFNMLDSLPLPAWINDLLKSFIEIEICDGNAFLKNAVGLPQGLSISPMLSNLYLREFDEAFNQENSRLVRYSDDFVILCKNETDARAALETARERLADLGLSLNPQKTNLLPPEATLEYLGTALSRSGAKQAPPALHRGIGFLEPAFKEHYSMAPSRTLYVQTQGASIRKQGGKIHVVKSGETLLTLPGKWIREVLIFGNCHLSTHAYQYFLSSSAPVFFLSNAGKYFGELRAFSTRGAHTKISQIRKMDDPDFTLNFSRAVACGKVGNQLVFINRFAARLKSEELEKHSRDIEKKLKKMKSATTTDSIRGLEGVVSHSFFSAFSIIIRKDLEFKTRNRRPPLDPVNSLLSLAYTILTQLCSSALARNGLDPHIGFFHMSHRGIPALACDLAEEFRTPIVDSFVSWIANSGALTNDDFYYGKEEPRACLLTKEARKEFFVHLESRLNTPVTNQETKRRLTYRDAIFEQSREIKELVLGRRLEYKPFKWRA